jgi:hypothetical protein
MFTMRVNICIGPMVVHRLFSSSVWWCLLIEVLLCAVYIIVHVGVRVWVFQSCAKIYSFMDVWNASLSCLGGGTEGWGWNSFLRTRKSLNHKIWHNLSLHSPIYFFNTIFSLSWAIKYYRYKYSDLTYHDCATGSSKFDLFENGKYQNCNVIFHVCSIEN